jgi:hypothetical protein
MLIPAVAQVLLVLSACSPGSESSGGLASEAGAAGTGRLVVQVSNLPAGASAAIVVTGPNGFNQAVVRSDTLDNLPVGIYTIGADTIVWNQNNYSPNPLLQTVSITAGSHPTKRVSYSLASGSLQVVVNGLPSDAVAAISVTGPGGFVAAVTATTTLWGLTPGTYSIVASTTTTADGSVYAPSPVQQSISVAKSLTPKVKSVGYAAITGALTVSVTGLPSGVSASLTVTGPGGFSRSISELDALTGSSTLTGLAPGTYTVSAAAVISGSLTYIPTPTSQSAPVSIGVTATAAVGYASSIGALTVGIQGLPAGAAGSVVVTGPAGFSQNVTASQTLSGLVAGTYTISAAGVNSGGYTWAPTPVSQTVSLTTGSGGSAVVVYAASTGSLAVAISGLPGGTPASVSLTGPGGFSQSLAATGTVVGLAPGTYTLAASSVSGTSVYTPAPPSQTAVVTSGATASVGVVYSTSGGGTASLDLTINGAYLVQAAQRYDGSVPLVAGRDAYLRVFALANQTNAVAPRVRVRLYSGSTLVQTYTISAPAAGVPTSVDESSLTNSWNVLVPGALVQPGLKLLADVDPDGAVTESDESDNQFPVSGTPAAIDVRSLATFAFRLVPVRQQVNGLQGDVTTSNKESYLGDLKAMLPIGAYDADVRAVYTTTAPALDAGNSNGAWGTIISELYALRGADASSRYYYGVVKTSYNSGVAGLGYVGGTAHTAVGWDASGSAPNVLAHEVGHNLGQQHAPCGGAGSPDPAYPYPGGVTGRWGLNLTSLTLQPPTLGDLMGYCHPNWISDYNWSAMVGYRQSSLLNLQAQGATGDAGLLVWGRITPAGVVLEPAFKVAMGSDLTPRVGPNQLELLGADGATIRTVSFAATELAEQPGGGGAEQHFAFVLPLDAQLEGALAGLRVSAGSRVASRTVAAVPTPADPGQELTRPNGEQVQVRWDATRYPMVMVRDAMTHEVLSFARGGTARLWTRSGSFDLSYSDGVRTVARQGRVMQ